MENAEVVQYVEEEATIAGELVVQAQNLVIHNSKDSESAGEWLKDIKARYNALEKKRVSIVKPINDSVKEINQLFKKPQLILGTAEKFIKKALLTWNNMEQVRIAAERDKENRKAESRRKRFLTYAEKAEAAGDFEKAEEYRMKAEEVEVEVTGEKVEHAAGTFVVKRWKAVVTDIDALVKAVAEGQVSNEAVEPNFPFLNGLAKRLKGAVNIPGVKFVEEESISSRSE